MWWWWGESYRQRAQNEVACGEYAKEVCYSCRDCGAWKAYSGVAQAREAVVEHRINGMHLHAGGLLL